MVGKTALNKERYHLNGGPFQTISGMSVANKVLPAGNTTISNLPEGMYLLKATNQNGAVSISKLMVK